MLDFVALDFVTHAIDYLRDQPATVYMSMSNIDARQILIHAQTRIIDNEEAELCTQAQR